MKLNELFNDIQVLHEGINDKGIFKCLFVIGIPASGKSTLVNSFKKYTGVTPKIINFDDLYVYLSLKHDVDIKVDSDDALKLRKDTIRITTKKIALHLSGMLPLIVDTTLGNIDALHNRLAMLEHYGYDVCGIYKEPADLHTTLARANGRDRGVDEDYIKTQHTQRIRRMQLFDRYFKLHDFPLFYITEDSIKYKHLFFDKIEKFFNDPIKNPIGLKKIEILKHNNAKYLDINNDDFLWWREV